MNTVKRKEGAKGFARVAAALLAMIMVISSIPFFAFSVTPEKTGVSQLNLASIKAVDVSSTIAGIRAYTDVVDTTRIYQQNEVIFLAVTLEVKNLAKSPNTSLESIEDKSIDVKIGSDNIDFSLAKSSSPTVLSYIYSGDIAGNIGSVATAMLGIGNIVSYDKKNNELSFTVTGKPVYQTGAVNALNIGATVDDKGRIVLPALKAKDGETTIQVGSQTYKLPYSSPDALQYTVLLSGVVRENTKNTGSFYAKIMLSNAEVFEDFATYYVKYDGTLTDSKPSGTKYVDYVEVNVEKLEIKNGYTVYRYFVPSNGMLGLEVPIQYRGDSSSHKGQVMARVNPNVFDKSSSNGQSTVNVAGGVRKVQAHKTNNISDKTSEVPMSSVVYTSKASFYAPSFYSGVTKTEGNGVLIEEDVMVKAGQIKQSKDVTIAQSYKATITYDQAYGTNFDYIKDIVVDVNSNQGIVYGSLEKAQKAWSDDVAAAKPDVPAEFDAKLYPYIVFNGTDGAQDAVGSYQIALTSAESGKKTKVTITLNVNGSDEVGMAAFENWTPSVTALNAIETVGGTTYETKELELVQKKDSVQTWYEDGFVSGKVSFFDDQFSVAVTDTHNKTLIENTDYKLAKAVSNGKVTSIGIIPILGENDTIPDWVSDGIKVKASYIDPEAPTSTGTASETTEKADAALLNDVVGHNGITAYVVTTADDETPVVTLTTEEAYFSSDDASSIAAFDNGRRIYHAGAKNFIYADSNGGSVSGASKIASVFSYFGLDTGFNTTYKLQAEDFEKFGANAAYTDKETGEFKFGIVIPEDKVNEGTEEEDLLEEPEEEEVELEPEEEVAEEPEEEVVEEEPEVEIPEEEVKVPATGDGSINVALTMVSSALVAFAGFVLITRKIRSRS